MTNLLFCALVLSASMLAQIEGTWLASIDTGAVKLRLVFHLSRQPNGAVTGTLDSPDQGAMGLPVHSVTVNGRAVTIQLKIPPATYAGALSEDGSHMEGVWQQGIRTAPVVFRRVESVPGLDRPQEPRRPFPYREEDVAYPSKAADVRLAGTLTMPESGGPFPAVLLVSGSGPQDRDETVAGHKPFLVIADRLTRHGVAVLRVDDRGTGKSTGDFWTSTIADFVEDAAGSLAYLKTRKEIDAKRIGLIGHSEGAMIVPVLASSGADVACVVLTAGPGVSGREILLAQQEAISKAAGTPEPVRTINRRVEEAILSALNREKDPAKLQNAIRAAVTDATGSLPDAAREAASEAVEAHMKEATAPWFRYLMNFDPAPALRKLKTPALVLSGSLDLQVPSAQNLPAIAKALEEAGNEDYEIVKFPGLNHLFQTAKTGLPVEYANIPETIAPAVLDHITAWIARRR